MLGTLSLPLKPSFPLQQSCHRKMSLHAAVAEVAQPSPSAAAGRRSLYEVLRIRRNASQVEIKTAYRTLAKIHHPDATSRFMDSTMASAAASSSSSDGSDFIEIHQAYATLSDPDARAAYDLNLNVDSRRRWDTVGVSGRYRSPGWGRLYPTRRWETDQCW